MSADREGLQTFFEEYGAGPATFDADAVAARWGVPGMLMTDDAAAALDEREVMAGSLRQGFPLYQALGLGGVTPEILEAEPVTQRITRVLVRWTFTDTDGRFMATGDDLYVVREDAEGPPSAGSTSRGSRPTCLTRPNSPF